MTELFPHDASVYMSLIKDCSVVNAYLVQLIGDGDACKEEKMV